jgi:hypothetical protein
LQCLLLYFHFDVFIGLSVAHLTTESVDIVVPTQVEFTEPPGSAETITITIDNDQEVEETECFEISLENPTSGTLDAKHITTTVCIKDDDVLGNYLVHSYLKICNQVISK